MSKFPQLADGDWLRQQYLDSGRARADIAAEVGCSTATLKRALRVHGIRLPFQGPRPRPLEDRLWSRVELGPIVRADLGPCWLWTGAVNAQGYGELGRGRHDEGNVLAHCAAYELLVGLVPEGLELDHLCRVRRCVNTNHLEPVTHRENMRRAAMAHV